MEDIKPKKEIEIGLIETKIEKPFSCEECPKSFSHARTLKTHKLYHTDAKLFQCDECLKTFCKPYQVKIHKDSVHLSIRPFLCDHCAKTFSSLKYLNEHKRGLKSESKFLCEHCPKVFQRLAKMTAHEKLHMQPFPCNLCTLSFSSQNKLVSHKLLHDNHLALEAYTDVPCNECKKIFKTRANLLRHMRIHTGEKPFPCNVCERSFSQYAQLNVHIKTVHNGERPFNCEICGKTFAQSGAFYLHKRTKHDNVITQKYPCELCGYIATQKSSLKVHNDAVHKGIKYDCEFCIYQGTTKQNVQKHTKSQHAKEIHNLALKETNNLRQENKDIFILNVGQLEHENNDSKLESDKKCLNTSDKIKELNDISPKDDQYLQINQDVMKNNISEKMEQAYENDNERQNLSVEQTVTNQFIVEKKEIVNKENKGIQENQQIIHSKEDDLVELNGYSEKESQCLSNHENTEKMEMEDQENDYSKADTKEQLNDNSGQILSEDQTMNNKSTKKMAILDMGEQEGQCSSENKTVMSLEIFENMEIAIPENDYSEKDNCFSVVDNNQKDQFQIMEKDEFNSSVELKNSYEKEGQYLSKECKEKTLRKSEIFEKELSSIKSEMLYFSNSSTPILDGKENKVDSTSSEVNIKSENKQHELFSCSICDYESANRRNVKGHIRKVHEETRYPCDQCTYRATERGSLKRHIDSIHNKIKKTVRYHCDQCPYQATENGSLKRHINSIHNQIKKTVRYHCDQCTYQATERGSLKRHMDSIHNNIKKRFQYSCDQCPYKTTENGSFQRHINSHTNSILSKINLKSENDHEQIEFHENTKKMEYQEKDYIKENTIEELNEHSEQSVSEDQILAHKHTKKIPQNGNDIEDNLTSNYEGVHYFCDQCDFKSNQKGGQAGLNQHIRTAHEGLFYQCPHCTYKNAAKGTLNIHIMKTHKTL